MSGSLAFPPIRSERLTMIACDVAIMEAAILAPATLGPLVGAVPDPDWLGPDLAGVLPLMLAALRGDPAMLGWQAWLIVMDGMIVGSIGAHGPPVGGAVEIGFSIAPGYRRRGLATEAARAMCDHLSRQPGVTTIVARADAGNVASIKVLEAAGMRRRGGEGPVHGDVVHYERSV